MTHLKRLKRKSPRNAPGIRATCKKNNSTKNNFSTVTPQVILRVNTRLADLHTNTKRAFHQNTVGLLYSLDSAQLSHNALNWKQFNAYLLFWPPLALHIPPVLIQQQASKEQAPSQRIEHDWRGEAADPFCASAVFHFIATCRPQRKRLSQCSANTPTEGAHPSSLVPTIYSTFCTQEASKK